MSPPHFAGFNAARASRIVPLVCYFASNPTAIDAAACASLLLPVFPTLCRSPEEKSGAWLTQPVSSLDADEVAAQLDELYRTAYRMAKAARDDRVVARVRWGRRAGGVLPYVHVKNRCASGLPGAAPENSFTLERALPSVRGYMWAP